MTHNNQETDPDYPATKIIQSMKPHVINDHITQEQCLPLLSAFWLKREKMLYTTIEFSQKTMEALIDSGALVNWMSEAEEKHPNSFQSGRF